MKRTKIAWTLMFLAAIAAAILAGGCSHMNENEIMAASQQLLTEKYDEEFTAIDIRKNDYGSYYVWARPEKLPGTVIRAEIGEELELQGDDYPVKKVCADLTANAEELMRDYGGDHFIHTDHISDFCFSDDLNISADEYLAQNSGDRLDISIFAEEGADLESFYRAVEKVSTGAGVGSGWIDVYIIPTGSLKELQGEIERCDDKGAEGAQEIIAKAQSIFIEIGDTVPSAEEFRRGLEK